MVAITHLSINDTLRLGYDNNLVQLMVFSHRETEFPITFHPTDYMDVASVYLEILDVASAYLEILENAYGC